MTLIVCPECHRSISDTATVCPKCGLEMTPGGVDRGRRLETAYTAWSVGCVGFFVLLIVSASQCRSDRPSTNKGEAKTSWQAARDRLNSSGGSLATRTRPATEVDLRSPDGGKVYLAATSKGYDKMLDTVMARDDLGLTQMLRRGELFVVPSGTRALVLDRSVWSESVEVRILSGDRRGASGWTSMKMIR